MDRISFAPTSPDHEMFDEWVPVRNPQPKVEPDIQPLPFGEE